MSSATQTGLPSDLVVDVGPVAHGGHCVARHEGRVVFVRHAIPGEKVRLRLTDAGESSKFWRANVVEVLEPSPDRVRHFWHAADALRTWPHGHPPVGGAEFGHISLDRQRRLKAGVLAEQLKRLAGVELPTEVEGVGDAAPGLAHDAHPHDAHPQNGGVPGLGWRTRASFAVTTGGKLGMHAHRSDLVIPVREMPLAVDGINALNLWDIDLQGIERVDVAAPANGSRRLVLLTPGPGTRQKRISAILAQLPQDTSVAYIDAASGDLKQLRGRSWVQESAAGHEFRVTGDGFWQIHQQAPETLVAAVTGFLHDGGFLAPGAVVADLYAGAGLFTAALADAVGTTGSVCRCPVGRRVSSSPTMGTRFRPASHGRAARFSTSTTGNPSPKASPKVSAVW